MSYLIKKHRKKRTPEEKIRRGKTGLYILASTAAATSIMAIHLSTLKTPTSEQSIEQLLDSALNSAISQRGIDSYAITKSGPITAEALYPENPYADSIRLLQSEEAMERALGEERGRLNADSIALRIAEMERRNSEFITKLNDPERIYSRRTWITTDDHKTYNILQAIRRDGTNPRIIYFTDNEEAGRRRDYLDSLSNSLKEKIKEFKRTTKKEKQK